MIAPSSKLSKYPPPGEEIVLSSCSRILHGYEREQAMASCNNRDGSHTPGTEQRKPDGQARTVGLHFYDAQNQTKLRCVWYVTSKRLPRPLGDYTRYQTVPSSQGRQVTHSVQMSKLRHTRPRGWQKASLQMACARLTSSPCLTRHCLVTSLLTAYTPFCRALYKEQQLRCKGWKCTPLT